MNNMSQFIPDYIKTLMDKQKRPNFMKILHQSYSLGWFFFLAPSINIVHLPVSVSVQVLIFLMLVL